ncbi:TetR/AcrR family transcriptional regulator [Agromyces marinus]|nr:hypothetical protein [Agromyces marinus]
MRSVAAELGVEAMSLYHHVANKNALLDSLADWAFEQIVAPEVDAPGGRRWSNGRDPHDRCWCGIRGPSA